MCAIGELSGRGYTTFITGDWEPTWSRKLRLEPLTCTTHIIYICPILLSFPPPEHELSFFLSKTSSLNLCLLLILSLLNFSDYFMGTLPPYLLHHLFHYPPLTSKWLMVLPSCWITEMTCVATVNISGMLQVKR